MGRWGGISVASLLLFTVGPAAAAPAQRQDDGAVIYIAARGDSLYGLARQHMLRMGDYPVVQRLNRIADPHRIPVGTRLRFPIRLLRTEPLSMRLVAYRGDLGIQRDGTVTAPAIGLDIAQGSILQTGIAGYATIQLSDGSRFSLPSQSRVKIGAARRILMTGGVDIDLVVERGRVETEAAPVPVDKGRFRLRTPIAVSAVRGTKYRVAYEADGTNSLTEVLEGTVGVGADANVPTPIEAGFGAGVSPDGRLYKDRLLAPPVLRDPGRVHVDPLVTLTLDALPDARGYHVQIGADAGFVDVIAAMRSAGPEVAFPAIPNGRWFVRVSAIGPGGLEGMTQSYAIRRVLTGLDASADALGPDIFRFRWSGAGEGRRFYRFQLLRQGQGTVPVVDEPALEGEELRIAGLTPGTYSWRVGVRQLADGDDSENWLPAQTLIVAAP